jgi:hypothetical protein
MPLGTFFGGLFLELLPNNLISFDVEKKENISTSLRPYFIHFSVLVLVCPTRGGAAVRRTSGAIVIFWIMTVVLLKFIFYYPGSAKKSDAEAERIFMPEPSDTQAYNNNHTRRTSILEEERRRYSMRCRRTP